jgi:acyl-CoA thioester hydrolase
MPEPVLTPVARYRVLFADCDPMRIVYYATYFRLFEIGRAELFRGLGHPFKRYVDRGLYLAVIAAECRYRRPARYDDQLDLLAAVAAVGRARLSIVYGVERDGERLADGRTDHALVDDAGRPQRIPPAVRSLFGDACD